MRLLQATDPETAYSRAIELGQREEHSYQNNEGERVVWEFEGLADLHEVRSGQLDDGAEVYSWMSRGRPSDSVLSKEKLAVFRVEDSRV